MSPSPTSSSFPSSGSQLQVGKVSVVADNVEYAPQIFYWFSKTIYGNQGSYGFLYGDDYVLRGGIPTIISEASEIPMIIQYSDDFQVLIVGRDPKNYNYSLYDDKLENVYEDESEFSPPSEKGIYILLVDVTWRNDETTEYMRNIYVFKIEL